MSTRIISYVAYQYIGSITGESVTEVQTRNTKTHAKKASLGVAWFYFFDVTVTNGARSKPHNISKTYYLDAKVMDAASIKKLPGNHRELLRQMRSEGLDNVVRCRTGGFVEPAPKYAILTTQ
jgi:hypothetical protein